jgi:hypothetical protein
MTSAKRGIRPSVGKMLLPDIAELAVRLVPVRTAAVLICGRLLTFYRPPSFH